ncbi:TlpA family protein disulfide reductase [Sphingobacterium faecale]|uniref:TlpA family protein disulfide reductase n=1 Tax=Sphingobacterium faecale TaxID=2803775 RepID=A0ABS1R2V1_9SPHI|nr:TlpA disulfide reductase family protein [Sphingobacterium faecale]MBL1409013.1 TlpA family protein disulfide reductase [Sphingobacterium faecale]
MSSAQSLNSDAVVSNNMIITPLKVGDKLSEEVWRMPLNVLNHPNRKDLIKLQDYKGKLIILDFWATWCSSCIKAIQAHDSLGRSIGNDVVLLPVTKQTPEVVQAFFSLPAMKDKPFFSIVSEELAQFFPHRLVPHYVWIDGTGTVVAITGLDAVNVPNIQRILHSQIPSLNSKVDVDPLMPLFVDKGLLPDHTRVNGYKMFYKGYVPGLPSMSNFKMYHDGASRVLLSNMNAVGAIRTLLMVIWGRYSPKRFIYEGIDESGEKEGDNERFTLDLIESGVSTAKLSRAAFQDIITVAPLHYELRMVPKDCLVLSYSSKKEDAVGATASAVSLKRISGWLDNICPDRELVMDETGLTAISADSKDFTDVPLDSAITILAKYGISVKKERRMVELCFISQRN